MSYGSQIIGVGSAFPERIMENSEFEQFVDTSDEWIRTRTGIQTRRIADPRKGESTATLSLTAAQRALKKAGVLASELDFIVVGTVTADTVMPSTANYLQGKLGAPKAFGFDLQAACSGFLYGLSVADHFMRAGTISTALVVGAETLSTVINWKDRTTCVLFGDGAGAVVLRRTEAPNHRVLGVKLFSDGSHGPLLQIPHGYSAVPPYSPEYRAEMRTIKMAGGEIFKHAVRNMCNAATQILDENKMTVADVDFFIFHQANIRIIEMCAKTLGVDKSKTWLNVDRYGNTSAATLPVCLDEAWAAGVVKPGDKILMATFGGGLTWASALVQL